MDSSIPTCFKASEAEQPSTSAQRPGDELSPAHNFIVIDLDELYDTDHDTDEPEDFHVTEVNILEQLLLEKRLRESGAVPARKGLIPDTPHDHSVAHLAQRLRASGAELDAVEYLIDEVWPGGNITLEGLMAPMGAVELRVFGLTATSAKYLGLFRRQDGVGLCRLCPLDSRLDFKRPETGLYHITRDHLDMGYGCQCGCGIIYWTETELRRHWKRKALEKLPEEMRSSALETWIVGEETLDSLVLSSTCSSDFSMLYHVKFIPVSEASKIC